MSKFDLSSVFKAFGDVLFSENTNPRISGSGNTGTVKSNANLKLSATSCKLDIYNCSNVEIEAENSDLICKYCPNLFFKGKNNKKILLEDNKNLKFHGDENNSEIISNSNSTVNSTGSELKLSNNKNLRVTTTGSNVFAENNANLSITGTEVTVSAKGTVNHNIEKCTGNLSGETHNKLELKFGGSVSSQSFGFISGLFGSNPSSASTSINFHLVFSKKVKVDDKSYELDNFTFKLIPESEFKYVLKLADGGFDTDTLTVKSISLSEIQVSGTKNGVKQLLQVTAPAKISTESGNGKILNIDLTSSSL